MGLYFTQDAQFDFELSRTLGHAAYGGAELGECLATARRVKEGDYDSWYDEWFTTGERLWQAGEIAEKGGHPVSARDAYLRACNYFRTAEFFLHGDPNDPRIRETSGRSVDSFHRAAPLLEPAVEPVLIPYEDTTLPGYFMPATHSDGRAPVVIIHNGFDGTAEELYVMGGRAGQERGYHVLAFDGPGQGQVIRQQGIPFRPDWENVIGRVVDYLEQRPEVDQQRIALVGISMGGVLAPRAAAYESRLAALVAFDGVYDLQSVPLDFVLGLPVPEWDAMRLRLAAPSDPELDAIIAEKAAPPGPVRWQVEHGAWVFGVDSPRQAYAAMGDYTVRGGLAERIACPTLVLSAENDMTLAGQAEMLVDHLTCPSSFALFTAEEGGDLHNQVDVMRKASAVIYDWLDGVFSMPATRAGR